MSWQDRFMASRPGDATGVCQFVHRMSDRRTELREPIHPATWEAFGSFGHSSNELLDSQELQLLERTQAELIEERDRLKREVAQLPQGDPTLPLGFEFGRRIYQCMMPNPAVAYRNSPRFSDKVT